MEDLDLLGLLWALLLEGLLVLLRQLEVVLDLVGRHGVSGTHGRAKGIIFRALGRLELVAGHDVDEEVELVVFGDGHRDVVALQSASLVVLGVDPSS